MGSDRLVMTSAPGPVAPSSQQLLRKRSDPLAAARASRRGTIRDMDTSIRTAFKRIDTEYRSGPPSGAGQPLYRSGAQTYPGYNGYQGQPAYPGTGVGGGNGWAGPGGRGYGGGGTGGGGGYGGGWGQPVPPGPVGMVRPFSAARAFDKLLVLSLMAAVSGAVGYIAVPIGLAFACMAVAFGLVLLSWFRMRWVRVIAPAYAVLEGLALGSVSAAFATFGHGVVPTAIVFTAVTFVAALFLYRTGLVRVTPRMVAVAFMGALGLVVVGLLSLIGLSLPGVASLGTAGLIFGVAALAIAVVSLFTDFAYVTQAEAAALPSDAEWAAAFAMMTALVLVYISILRIAAVAYGGGGRRS